ncbi:DUF4743 domain-containing protein [Oleisolibacter albus]|uniref:DUF4743 domain-containing protein n=1 Tax=Oleisolibacter albus TaxID=2171757 RepID=UPI000DF3B58E|nr:DUF4743 domain-containing protein [Oleisolibacter albus]
MSFLRHIIACNTHDLDRFRPFRVAGRQVGWLRLDFLMQLARFGGPFVPQEGGIALADDLDTAEARSSAVAEALAELVRRGVLPRLRGEIYPVLTEWGATPLLGLDRGVVSFFGIKSFGLHINGFVRRPDGLHLWVGLRAKDRGIAPGQYDNLVAGGQPMGLTLAENLVKEAREEADLPPDLAARATPVGAISYRMENGRGLKDDTLFCYDLDLAPDVVPRNTDGEVERFELWPVERVAASVRDSDDWKFNVNLVVIDFLIRHGVLTPEHPEYLALCRGLRRPA